MAFCFGGNITVFPAIVGDFFGLKNHSKNYGIIYQGFGLGALAGDVARFGEVLGGEAEAGTWTLRVVGVLATLAVVWLVSRAARRALQDVETSL